MAQTEIQNWLTYWANGSMVAVDRIRSPEDVYTARRFCSCMRTGRFTEDQVSDPQIWRALVAMRSLAEAA